MKNYYFYITLIITELLPLIFLCAILCLQPQDPVLVQKTTVLYYTYNYTDLLPLIFFRNRNDVLYLFIAIYSHTFHECLHVGYNTLSTIAGSRFGTENKYFFEYFSNKSIRCIVHCRF